MFVVAKMVCFVERFSQPPVCTKIFWMYILYIIAGFGRKMLNLLFAVFDYGQLLVSPLCSSSSNMQRC
jgi:hypothetical protein